VPGTPTRTPALSEPCGVPARPVCLRRTSGRRLLSNRGMASPSSLHNHLGVRFSCIYLNLELQKIKNIVCTKDSCKPVPKDRLGSEQVGVFFVELGLVAKAQTIRFPCLDAWVRAVYYAAPAVSKTHSATTTVSTLVIVPRKQFQRRVILGHWSTLFDFKPISQDVS